MPSKTHQVYIKFARRMSTAQIRERIEILVARNHNTHIWPQLDSIEFAALREELLSRKDRK